MDAMLATEAHGTQAAVVKGVQQLLALAGRVAEATVAAGADNGRVGGGEFRWCRLHTRLCMQFMLALA